MNFNSPYMHLYIFILLLALALRSTYNTWATAERCSTSRSFFINWTCFLYDPHHRIHLYLSTSSLALTGIVSSLFHSFIRSGVHRVRFSEKATMENSRGSQTDQSLDSLSCCLSKGRRYSWYPSGTTVSFKGSFQASSYSAGYTFPSYCPSTDPR